MKMSVLDGANINLASEIRLRRFCTGSKPKLSDENGSEAMRKPLKERGDYTFLYCDERESTRCRNRCSPRRLVLYYISVQKPFYWNVGFATLSVRENPP